MRSGEKTKLKIAKVFKTLLTDEPFDNITISDITNACDLNRLTFYYHFQDKYELMNWIFYKDIVEPMEERVNIDNWLNILEDALKALCEERDYYINVIRQEKPEFRTYVYKTANEIMYGVIKDADAGSVMKEDEKIFLADFFTYGISGVISEWITRGMNVPPEDVAKKARYIVESVKTYAVERYSQEQEE